MKSYIRHFEDLRLADVPEVGGKNASLGELISQMSGQGISVPNGFVITAEAYAFVLLAGGIRERLAKLMSTVDKTHLENLARTGLKARELVKQAGLPPELVRQISEAYKKLEEEYGADVDVAVRSSATAEDLPDASFAGQQETFLNVRGEPALMEACLNCFASLFTDRAIAYRIDKGFDHMAVRLSIGVQKMVRSDLASSGVIFTLDPESGFQNVVLVTSAYGLGENVVGGRVDPDEFIILKPTPTNAKLPIIRRKLGAKQIRMVYSGHGTRTTRNLDVMPSDRARFSLTDEEVGYLARAACKIEAHYSKHYGKQTPMDIEWAKDGRDGQLYIVQARPETVHSLRNGRQIESFELKEKGPILLTGRSIGQKIGAGEVRVVASVNELDTFKAGEVLVADMTDPDWEPVMKLASAIVTNRGGRTCHAAIVSRELGVPCLVGTERATEVLTTGQEVTVSCAEGSAGYVYEGKLPFVKNEYELDKLPRTRTRVMLNIGNPEHAFKQSFLPVDGVGLAREEFIIANEVKIHPLALTRLSGINDSKLRAQIHELTKGYATPEEYFVTKLAEGIGTIAAAFFPREIIVRLSDFKTNEYANLIGGHLFEPTESNPMIGFRGASRYYDERYHDGFELECRALARVRDDMGLTNVKIMVPMCRTGEEAKLVVEELKKNGLVRGRDGLELYCMCELPANIWAMDQFAPYFDGFSIGSNDLTQMILGVDRDSEIVSRLFDERNPAVMRAIAQAIASAHKAGCKIGICGQAPSDYPEFVEFLVEQGIDSVSLSEDAIIKTVSAIGRLESEKNISAQAKPLAKV
jgi:pyruvate,water dikinase